MKNFAWIRLLLVLAFPAQLYGAPNKAGKSLTIGVEACECFPNYDFAKRNEGAANSILALFAAENNISLKYQSMQASRLSKELLNGSIDLRFPDNKNWQQDAIDGKEIVYSNPFFEYVEGIMVVPAKKNKGKEALKTIGVLSGTTLWDFLDEVKNKQVQVVEESAISALLEKVVKGTVDGAFVNVAVAQSTLRNMEKSGALEFDSSLPHSRSGYSLSSLKHREVVELFNGWAAKNKERIVEITKKYQINIE